MQAHLHSFVLRFDNRIKSCKGSHIDCIDCRLGVTIIKLNVYADSTLKQKIISNYYCLTSNPDFHGPMYSKGRPVEVNITFNNSVQLLLMV